MEYKLFAVRVFVTDWKRAIRFYSETLGMTIAYQSDEMGWAQMAPGEGQLALERVDPSDEEGRALVGRFVGRGTRVWTHGKGWRTRPRWGWRKGVATCRMCPHSGNEFPCKPRENGESRLR